MIPSNNSPFSGLGDVIRIIVKICIVIGLVFFLIGLFVGHYFLAETPQQNAEPAQKLAAQKDCQPWTEQTQTNSADYRDYISTVTATFRSAIVIFEEIKANVPFLSIAIGIGTVIYSACAGWARLR
jgi:hypothetical protein